MTPLAEFLLARNVEKADRAKYETPHRPDCETHLLPHEGGLPCTCDMQAEMLAECEVIRQIVERCSRWETPHPGVPHTNEGFEQDDVCDLCVSSARTGERLHPAVLTLLALPHVNHPDYQEEWRP